jgi:hypothetical protein
VKEVLCTVGARLHDLPSGEPEPAALHQRAIPGQRRREPHRPLREPPVWRGVDLLRRQGEHVLLAPRRAGRCAEPARSLEQSNSEVGAGPSVGGVSLVEARDRLDLQPEPIGVWLAEEAPPSPRSRGHRPGRREARGQIAHDLPRAPWLCPCGSGRIDVREQLRIGVPEHDDESGALGIGAAVSNQAGVRSSSSSAACSGTRAPPCFGHRAKERCMRRLAVDDQRLAFSEVDADTPGELGVARGVVDRATIPPTSRAVKRGRPARRRARASRRPTRSRSACRWRSRSGSRDPCRGSRAAGRDRAGAATRRR